MKKIIIALYFLLFATTLYAQTVRTIASLKQQNRDSLALNNPELRELIEIKFKKDAQGFEGLDSPADIVRFNERCSDIYNVLRKLRREAKGFLTT